MNRASIEEAATIFKVTEALGKAVKEELPDECVLCDRETVGNGVYCSQHYFGTQMIEKKVMNE